MIYYDLTCYGDVVRNFGNYSGGSNYALLVLEMLLKKASDDDIKVTLIVPPDMEDSQIDTTYFKNKGATICLCDDMRKITYESSSTLFVPIVYGRNLSKISDVKRKNKDLRICATLHDRQHNYYRYDWKDSVYPISRSQKGVVGFINFYMRKTAFDLLYNSFIASIDYIFTASNYSMQKLNNKHVKYISPFCQINVFRDTNTQVSRGDYILFLGGDRTEKNLIRTIEAYQKFKRGGSEVKLIVTGVSENLKNAIIRDRKINNSLLKTDIRLLPYVSHDKMAKLYAQCRYVLFPSKGEGFGLPIMEAMSYGKTVLTSRTTAMPEIGGSCVIYVDPFSIESIAGGMNKMEDDTLLNRLEKYVSERYEILKAKSEMDTNIMIDEILRAV